MAIFTILLLIVMRWKKPKLKPKLMLRYLAGIYSYVMSVSWIYEWPAHFVALTDPLFAFFVIYASGVLGCVVMLVTSLASALRQASNTDTHRIDIALIAPGIGALVGLWPFVAYRRELASKGSAHGDRVYALLTLLRLIATNVYLAIGLFWYGWVAGSPSLSVSAIVGNAWAVFGAVASLILTVKFISTVFNTVIKRHSTPLILTLGSLATVSVSLVEQQLHQSIGFGPTLSLFGGLMLTCGVILLVARIFHRRVFHMSKSLHPQLDPLLTEDILGAASVRRDHILM